MKGKGPMDKAFYKVIRRDGLARNWAIIFCACCVLIAVTTVAQNSDSWLEYVRLILVLVAALTGVAVILKARTPLARANTICLPAAWKPGKFESALFSSGSTPGEDQLRVRIRDSTA